MRCFDLKNMRTKYTYILTDYNSLFYKHFSKMPFLLEKNKSFVECVEFVRPDCFRDLCNKIKCIFQIFVWDRYICFALSNIHLKIICEALPCLSECNRGVFPNYREGVQKRGERTALVRKRHSRTIAIFKAGKILLLSSWQLGCYALVDRRSKSQQSVKRRTLQQSRSCQAS